MKWVKLYSIYYFFVYFVLFIKGRQMNFLPKD